MKLLMIVFGTALTATSVFATEKSILPVQTGDVDVSIEKMKEACLTHEANDLAGQIEDFVITIQCQKDQNSWQKITKPLNLPSNVAYTVSGAGKGQIIPETNFTDLGTKGFTCDTYQEMSTLFSGSMTVTCDEFKNVESLVSLCIDGLEGSDGNMKRVDWVRTGDIQTGKYMADACPNEPKLIAQPEKAESK